MYELEFWKIYLGETEKEARKAGGQGRDIAKKSSGRIASAKTIEYKTGREKRKNLKSKETENIRLF